MKPLHAALPLGLLTACLATSPGPLAADLGQSSAVPAKAPSSGDAGPGAKAAVPRPLPVENLGVPVRTMRRAGEFLIPKPEGKGWWFLTCYNPVARNSLPCQICIVDLSTRQVRLITRQPSGVLQNCVAGQDGMYYLGHYAKTGIWQFHPGSGDLQWIDFPENQERILPFVMLTAPGDGKIYMGTASASARVVEFDPRTRRFRDFGVQGKPHPAPRYIYSMACDESHVYSAAGKNPWYLVATDRTTMQQRVLARDMAYLDVGGTPDRCAARITRRPDPSRPETVEHYRLRGGEMTPWDPSKDRPAPRAKEERPEMLLTRASPDSEGKAEIWWRVPRADWEHVDLVGIQTVPWGFRCIKTLPDGRLLGAPKAYEDFFLYDPRTRQFKILGKAPHSCSFLEVLDNKVYSLGYPSTSVFEIDLSRPWTHQTASPGEKEPDRLAPESNPRMCYAWGATGLPTHHVHGSALGADGLLYFGGHAERGAVGGGIGWWDPIARKAGGLRPPFLVQDCSGMTAARGGRAIVYSSHPVADPTGKLPRPNEARLFVLDTQTKTISLDVTPVPGMTDCGPIVAIDQRVYGAGWVGNQPIFYVFDLDQQKALHRQPLGEAMGPQLKLGPDGRIYTFQGTVLVRINPQDYQVTTLGSVDRPGRLEFLGNDLYLTGAEQLRRVTGVAGRNLDQRD